VTPRRGARHARSADAAEPYIREIHLRRERVPSFDEYPFNLPVVRGLDVLALHPAVTFLVGENGSGKSTLLEAIAVACGFNAEGGTRGFNFATRASHSPLHDYLQIVRGARFARDGFFLRAESLFNVASQVEQLGVMGYGSRSLHEQSHGESFMAVMTNRFTGEGLYLMDEPEAALSPSRQMSLLTLMHQFVRSRAQLLIATHSPILMAYPNAVILELGEWGIRTAAYEETEHFSVTRAFLDRYAAMLRVLLDEEEER
jgi:predicted ATPase